MSRNKYKDIVISMLKLVSNGFEHRYTLNEIRIVTNHVGVGGLFHYNES